jgi:hypothetical protein
MRLLNFAHQTPIISSQRIIWRSLDYFQMPVMTEAAPSPESL